MVSRPYTTSSLLTWFLGGTENMEICQIQVEDREKNKSKRRVGSQAELLIGEREGKYEGGVKQEYR